MDNMKLYFAGPLFSSAELQFSSAELQFNLQLTKKIEAQGFEVFLPQRDGIIEDSADISPEEKNRVIFAIDRQRIFETDIFLYVMDGRVPDEGAAVALGMAHSYKTLENENLKIVGLHTDCRASFTESKLNPMLFSPLDFLAESVEELLSYLNRIRLD